MKFHERKLNYMPEGFVLKQSAVSRLSTVTFYNLQSWASVIQHGEFYIKVNCTISCAVNVKSLQGVEPEKEKTNKQHFYRLSMRPEINICNLHSICDKYSAVVQHSWPQAHIASKFNLIT